MEVDLKNFLKAQLKQGSNIYSTQLSTKQALELQDKKTMYDQQIELRQRHSNQGQQNEMFNFGNTSVDNISQKNICKKPLDKLKVIHLKDCKLNQVMEDCLIQVKSFTPAAQLIATNIGVEDKNGDIMLLSFYNTFTSRVDTKVLDSIYPLGCCIAIKNPYLKKTMSGMFVLRNDNPSNLEIIQKESQNPKIKNINTNNVEVFEIISSLKEQGNKQFQENLFNEAIELYESALLQFQKANEEQINQLRELKVVLYSNISQCYLNLKQYQKALTNSENALKIDRNHVKSQGRKGQSLIGLNDFKKSLEVYLQISNKIECKQQIDNLQQLLERQSNGYSNEDLFCINNNSLQFICPYQGPIKIMPTKNKGRGIFLTKDVKYGELIIADENISIPKLNTKYENKQLFYGFNNDRTLDKNSSVQFKGYLIQRILEDVALRKRISYLYKGEKSNELQIPDLSIYRYNYYNEEDEDIVLSADDIQQIIRFNAFNHYDDEEHSNEQDILREKSMINPLISLINHNIIQNIKLVRYGKFTLVFAMKDIKKGKELCFDYLNGSQKSKTERELSLLNWNIKEI